MCDNRLIEEILKGDIEKFAILVRRYERLLFSYLISRNCRFQEAEDIVQESFIKAYSHLRSFDKNRKLSVWLLTIARNLMIDNYRKNTRTVSNQEVVVDWVNFGKDGHTKNEPQEILIRKENFRKVSEMIISLSDKLKTPFLMRIVNEYSYQEIAELLDLPLQTVKNRIFKARKILKEQRKI